MKKLIVASALAAAFAAPAFAQTAAPAAAEAAPASPHTLTANVGLFSSYRFRGIDQTFGKPACRAASITRTKAVSTPVTGTRTSARAPVSRMATWKWISTAAGRRPGVTGASTSAASSITTRVQRGPQSCTKADSGAVTNKELYIGGSWKTVSLKYYHSVDDYFSLRGWDANGTSTGKSTKGTHYLDLSATYDLGDGWGINGHVGHLSAKNQHNGSYTDWKIGVTKDFSGWVVGLSYVDTNAEGSCSGSSSWQPTASRTAG